MPRVARKASATRPRARRVRSTTAYRVVRGRGDYWTDVKKRWGQGGGKYKKGFSAAGSALGSAIGGGPGAAVGGVLGGLLNRAMYALTGFGDYTVRSNVLLESNDPPAVINRSNKEFVMRHREYITDIYSAGGTANTPSIFNNQSFPVNPGQSNTFPWLSSIAGKFEQYRLEGMLFEYKSLYSDAVVTQNGSIGSIILATEYNAGAPMFVSKQQMENYQFAQSCKPSHNVLHPIECARSQTVLPELYVRPSAVPVGEDIKTYDFGDFQIASVGIPLGAAGAPVALGELWVTYQIAMLKPKIPAVGPASYVDSGWSHFNTNNLVGGFTSAKPLADGSSSLFALPQNNIAGITFTSNSMSIPLITSPMRYMIDLWWTADVSTGSFNAPATGTIVNGLLINASIMTGSYVIPNVGAPAANIGAAGKYFVEVPAIQGTNTVCTIPFQSNGTFPGTGNVRLNVFVNAVPFGTI